LPLLLGSFRLNSFPLLMFRMVEEEERMYWEERRRYEEELEYFEWYRRYGRDPRGLPPPPPRPFGPGVPPLMVSFVL
jgi:hypothetical protein